MNFRRSCVASLALAASCLAVLGCGKGETRDNLVPVSGTVTLDGKPLEGASITFVGTGGTPGPGGVGVTGPDGKYELSHFRAGTGVDAGEYSVMITKMVLADGKPIPPGTESAADLNTKELIPQRYNQVTTLKATVTAGETKPFDFEVTSK